MATLGEKIRAARLERGLTQEQLAARDFTKSYISELERGARTPRLTTLKILARRLNHPLSYFLDGVLEDREPEAFLMIGLAHLHADAIADAQAPLRRALELAAQHGDEVLQARIEVALARVDRRLGRVAQARRRIERALQVLGRTGNPLLLARAQLCLGKIRLDAGEPESAFWAFEAAMTLASRASHDPRLLAEAHFYAGEAHLELCRVEEATRAFRAALDVAEPYRDPHRAGARQIELAVASAEQGHFEEAVERAGRALAVYDALAHRQRLAEIHQAIGDAEARGGRWDDAERHLRWSVVLHASLANGSGAAQVLGSLAEAMLGHTSPQAVQALAEAALALLPVEGEPRQRGHALRIRGMVCRFLGRLDEARAALDESLAVFEGLGAPRDAALVRLELTLLAIAAKNFREAERQVVRLRRRSRSVHDAGT